MNQTTSPRSGKIPLTLIIIASLAAGLGLWLGQLLFLSPATPVTLHTMRLLDPPRSLPAFSLESTQGTHIDNASLRGHYTLVFLGFTHCPDICPTTLADLAKAEKQWADLPEAQRPRILFVSVDPERDTPDSIHQYASFFSPSLLSGTSDTESLTQLASALSMVFAKSPLEGGGYTIDHTSWVAVLNPEGQLSGFIRPPLDPVAIAADLRQLLEVAP